VRFLRFFLFGGESAPGFLEILLDRRVGGIERCRALQFRNR
jgi:hypothetical protein